MKKILLFLTISAVAIAATPAARAHDDGSWHDAEQSLKDLYPHMDRVEAMRDKYGASPKMQDQIAELKEGLRTNSARVKDHLGDGRDVRDRVHALADLMVQVEAEYKDRAHHQGIVIHVSPY